ncbi:MAG: hypothetical protein Ta2E_09850 [Mycoplasmoidaceae bacterium]|nr:MAG: hypothetical protein Ta2E_09850 [Mycoplasmoidaceae bacterium]
MAEESSETISKMAHVEWSKFMIWKFHHMDNWMRWDERNHIMIFQGTKIFLGMINHGIKIFTVWNFWQKI